MADAPLGSQTNPFKLSPSDFAFLWQDCKTCFYLKVARRWERPRTIMPKIFNVIDNAMKKCFEGARTEALGLGLPPGVVRFGEKWVESDVVHHGPTDCYAYVRGKTDTILEFDDASFGVVDFKTSDTKEANVGIYGRQLHAYAEALNFPAEGKLKLTPTNKLGLIPFSPDTFLHVPNETAGSLGQLVGNLSLIEIPYEPERFLEFLGEVITVLGGPRPPDQPKCEWCIHRNRVLEAKI